MNLHQLWYRLCKILCPQRFCKGKNKGEIGEKDMETYQIEATIEKIVQGEKDEQGKKLVQDSIQLKGVGKYLFEKSKEKDKDKDKKYWNILEWKKPDEETSTEQDEKQPISLKYNQPIYFEGIFKDLLIPVFIEKKSLKFTLEEKCENEKKRYTITAVSNAST